MAISNIWKINGQTFASRNLSGVKAQLTTQAPDVLTFTQAAAYDADPEFDYGDVITVLRGSAKWFKGICTGISRRGSGSAERIDYQVSGPWWQLTKVTYQQQYARNVDGTVVNADMARLVLGTDENGQRLNSGQVITQAVAYAATALGGDALFLLGNVEVSTEMPYEELNALSVAEVIQRVLRWNPDAVAYFDYAAAEKPLLHIKRRANLDEQTYAHSDVTITDASINPRHDLQVDGVVVQYERIDTVDDEERKTLITDSAGPTGDPTKTLRFFFDLQGSSVSYVRQRVRSESIQEGSANWWSKRHPKLKNATGVSVANSSKEAVDDGEDNDGTSYGKELVSGSIADWMGGVGTCAQIVKADVTYTPDGGSAKTETLRLQVAGTNANSTTYSTIGSSSPAEPTPQGLAAAILSGVSALQYEGTIILAELDTGAETHLDKRIHLSGGRTEWASMGAQVYRVDYDLDGGKTQIQFGPAKHLGATDLFQIYRNVRTRKQATGLVRASTGGTGQNLPTRSPNTVAADDGGGPAQDHPWRIYFDGDDVVVSPGAINNEDAPEGRATKASQPTQIWAKANLSGMPQQAVQSVEITGLTPTESATVAAVLLGTISWNAQGEGTITQLRNTSLGLVSCTDSHLFFTIP